jgi:hypothetical protein
MLGKRGPRLADDDCWKCGLADVLGAHNGRDGHMFLPRAALYGATKPAVAAWVTDPNVAYDSAAGFFWDRLPADPPRLAWDDARLGL